jgi:hypothetical protein
MTEQQLGFWETAALPKFAGHLQLPKSKIAYLLQTHWTWIHPTMMFVSLGVFLRDAASGGSHFSPLLLAVLCLHSTRFTDGRLADDLNARVQLLLNDDIQRESSVATIQALLQLSAWEIGKGKISKSWLYSGMAFRMAIDLGIFVGSKISNMDVVSRTVRQQLAWSCYCWDKCISLYLGRALVLSEAPAVNSPAMDDLTENGIWTPYNGPIEADDSLPVIPCRNASTFANFCRITVIVNVILVTVYGSNTEVDIVAFITHTKQRLEEWRSTSPAHLQIEGDSAEYRTPHALAQK